MVHEGGFAETHISRVFFSGDRAYKLLKPVEVGFLDFTDRTARLEAARRELELNRRLAPDVYLGLADVHEGGELVDHMVVMRRMDEARRLEGLLRLVGSAAAADPDAAPSRAADCLRSVARLVAGLHLSTPPVARGTAGTVTGDDVRTNWEDNFAAIAAHVGTVIDPGDFAEVRQLATDYLEAGTALFDGRVADGWIRDGHGDLRAEDIFCLDDGPRILDCLAFSDRLRVADVLADIGFLAMDVLHLAGRELAEELLAAYHEFTAESHPVSLARHYTAYRAHVRVKIACLVRAPGRGPGGGAAPGSPVLEAKVAEARALHDLALGQLRAARLSVVVVGGAPGTGKSTVAGHLSSELGLALVSSDEVRKELAGFGHLEDHAAPVGEGIYTPEMDERTYNEVLREAEVLLSRGEPVVLDASWSSAARRRMARELATRFRARLVEIECRLDRDLAKRRVAARTGSTSDAYDAVVDHVAERAEPWESATPLHTTGALADVLERAVAIAGTHRGG